VRNEEEHAAAILRIEELMGAEFGSPEGDELDALTTLVVAYEEKHFPVALPDPIAYIEFRLDQQGLTRKDLEPMIGSRARVSEIMTGKRKLTLPMIRRLRDGLGIPADVLIGADAAPPIGGKIRSRATRPVRAAKTKSAGKPAATRRER
jgi:HTH-type transcriptional regulator/antitoxin HigA